LRRRKHGSKGRAGAGTQPGRRGKVLHWLYLLGIWIKGIDGVLEVIGGVLLLLVKQSALNTLIAQLTQHELATDHGDWVVVHIREAVSHLSSDTKLFASAYLLGHGVIKSFLVWGGLLRRKLWAFPTALTVIGAFIGYQTYRVIHRYSLGLICLTVLDAIVFALIWREYRMIKGAGGGRRTGD
jgi:uncharacterized membrane protein